MKEEGRQAWKTFHVDEFAKERAMIRKVRAILASIRPACCTVAITMSSFLQTYSKVACSISGNPKGRTTFRELGLA